MIKSQIINRGVKNPAVLKGLEKVPRHRFVNESLENSAYDDAPLPIGEGQT
ncbi:protein-L-isoaspartate O-methyltransferase, partial [candidate division KSB1 bacterium]|nr:protein-L-isoaspartate O-methyltransferase [candidate division KSB1 bacterium]